MQIDEATYKRMPPMLRGLFVKLPNDGSDEVVSAFPEGKGGHGGTIRAKKMEYAPNVFGVRDAIGFTPVKTSMNASRFFYCSKTSKADRGPSNKHETVKPQALMSYLCRLVTPPGGLVLDPFAGSGSTLLAARSEGFGAVGIELERRYCVYAIQRLEATE